MILKAVHLLLLLAVCSSGQPLQLRSTEIPHRGDATALRSLTLGEGRRFVAAREQDGLLTFDTRDVSVLQTPPKIKLSTGWQNDLKDTNNPSGGKKGNTAGDFIKQGNRQIEIEKERSKAKGETSKFLDQAKKPLGLPDKLQVDFKHSFNPSGSEARPHVRADFNSGGCHGKCVAHVFDKGKSTGEVFSQGHEKVFEGSRGSSKGKKN